MFYIIIKTIITWLVMILVTSNLLGFVVRGFFYSPPKVDDYSPLKDIFKNEARASVFISAIFLLITIIFYYALYHFFNLGIAISAAMLMFSRLPDLFFEIKTGEKISFKNMPKKTINVLTTIISWLALPVIFISYYFLK